MNEEKMRGIVDAPPQERSALLREYNRQIHHRRLPDRLYQPDERTVPPERKIALVGTSGSEQFAPVDDSSWEIWTVGRAAESIKRSDRWYELHRNEGNGQEWVDLLKEISSSVDGEIWSIYPLPGIDKDVHQFPVDEMIQRFGSYFMTSSFSWMMALAISELDGIQGEIAIYGADMEYGTEYESQRDGFRHFIELARFAGIYVTRLASAGLSYEPIPYPMRIDDPLLNKLDMRQVETLKQCLFYAQEVEKAQISFREQTAVIAALEKFPGTEEAIEAAQKELVILTEQLQIFQVRLGQHEAVELDQQWLRNYLS